MAVTAPSVFAGNPHFISVTATRSGDTLTVSGKEVGLGNETQVHIVALNRAPSSCGEDLIPVSGLGPRCQYSRSVT